MQTTARSIFTEHRDLIHDVAYDFYGTRMATCSSDHTVRIWELDKGSGEWKCTASWKAHSGSIWKVTWADPEFGQVISTCSFDRTAVVWEEVVGDAHPSDKNSSSHWLKRTTLVDSRVTVTDVKFGPKSLGLLLATCSADGFVRIYEAPDVMNLTQWSLSHEISIKISCSCIAWNPTFPKYTAPMLAIGSDDTSSANEGAPKVLIYEYNEGTRKWAKIEALGDITEAVNDLAFAPNLGRSFHMLGIAGRDMHVVALEPLPRSEEDNMNGSCTKFSTKVIAKGEGHNSTVWRVAWNVTGTILSSSGDDGTIRLWKSNYMNNWKCVSTLRGDGTAVGVNLASDAASFLLPPSSNQNLNSSQNNGRYLKNISTNSSTTPAIGNKSEVFWH